MADDKQSWQSIKYKDLVTLGAGWMLLAAILPLPYWYYEVLRWVVFISAIYIARTAFKLNKDYRWLLVVIATIIAFYFNPVEPIHADKFTWIYIDLVTAFLAFKANSLLE